MTVLVTGAAGFIAKHVIHNLLAEGYKNIGTVRCENEGDLIIQQFNSPNLTFEVVPEIANFEVINGLFEKHGVEIDVVIHMASPLVHLSSDYERTMMKPVIEGTKNILMAARNITFKGS